MTKPKPKTDPVAQTAPAGAVDEAAALEALKIELRAQVTAEMRAELRAEVQEELRPLYQAKLEEYMATAKTRMEAEQLDYRATVQAEFAEQAKSYAAEVKAAAKPAAPSQGAAVAVRYIGHRPTYTEGAYGTGILFAKGKSEFVPADKAELLLAHKDVYEPGDAAECGQPQAAAGKKPDESDDPIQQQRDVIAFSDKDALEAYARTHFNVELDKRHSLGDLRARVTGLLDQFGLG